MRPPANWFFVQVLDATDVRKKESLRFAAYFGKNKYTLMQPHGDDSHFRLIFDGKSYPPVRKIAGKLGRLPVFP